MSVLDNLLRDLKDTAVFLEAHKDLDIYQTVVNQQVDTWCRRLQRDRIPLNQAKTLIEQIQETFNRKKDLTTRVVACISFDDGSSNGKNRGKPKQTVNNFAAYLTRADQAALQSKISNYAKIDIVAIRMVKIGLTHPSEPCYGKILEHLALAH